MLYRHSRIAPLALLAVAVTPHVHAQVTYGPLELVDLVVGSNVEPADIDGDLDGDGLGDILTYAGGELVTYVQEPAGTFTEFTVPGTGTPSLSSHLVLSRSTLNDVLDAAVFLEDPAGFILLERYINDLSATNMGNLDYESLLTQRLALMGEVLAAVGGETDIDGDGAPDLVVLTDEGAQVLLNLNPSNAYTPIDLPLPADFQPTGGVFVGDLLPDSFQTPFPGIPALDVAITCTSASPVRSMIVTFENVGTGFLPGPIIQVSRGPIGLVGGDFDSDGDVDMVVSTSDTNPLGSVFGTVQFVASDGAGGFSVVETVDLPDAPSIGLEATDVDEDGDLDIVVSEDSAMGGGVTLVFNNGTPGQPGGVFRSTQSLGTSATYLAVGDLDEDGYSDLIVLDSRSPFALPTLGFQTRFVPEFIRGDANGDGVVDLLDPEAIVSSLIPVTSLPCMDAGDVNDDGVVDLQDAIDLRMFLNGAPISIPLPFPGPGPDPTQDQNAASPNLDLGCN